jgi:hypothetical protein
LPSGDFTNRLNASFDRKGAAISALLGSVNLPIISEIASSLESVVENSLSMETVMFASFCNTKVADE